MTSLSAANDAAPGHTSSGDAGDLTTLGALAPGAHVLVVGDGNFSFTRAFLRANTARIADRSLRVTATSLDTHAQLLEMYPKAGSILDELHTGGVRVLHGVNATRLETDTTLFNDDCSRHFDRIVFNFPHYAADGGVGNKRNKIHRHRQLLRDFFTSATSVLTRDGQVWVTLCGGQGGTQLERKRRAFGDTWQVAYCAAEAGLILQDAHLCPVDALAALGYYSVGYQSREKAFWTADAISHVFCRESLGLEAALPLQWTRDVSFWVTDESGFSDALLLAVVQKHFPEPDLVVTTTLLDEYRCPKSGRKSVTYRLEIASRRLALSRARVNEMAQAALTAIESSSFGASRAT